MILDLSFRTNHAKDSYPSPTNFAGDTPFKFKLKYI